MSNERSKWIRQVVLTLGGTLVLLILLISVIRTSSQSSANRTYANAANWSANRSASNSSTIRKYERFNAEINNKGQVTGLTQPYLPSESGSSGCSNPHYKNGVITKIRYEDSYKNDGKHVSGFSIQYANGEKESFDEEVSCCFGIWERSYSERQFLETLFVSNRHVTIGIQYCGTAQYKTLYSLRDNSKQSQKPQAQSRLTKSVPILEIGLIDNPYDYVEGPGCYFRQTGSAKTAKTYIFLGEGAGSILQNGRVETNKERVWLKINGRVQKFDLVSTTQKKNKQLKGSRYVETYRSGDITIRITKIVIGHEYYDGGEMSSATVAVTNGAVTKTVKAVGMCGM